MPQFGTGIIPSGATGAELAAVTRRAFVPKVVVQIYRSTATLSAFIAQAEGITGGVSPVTVPVQGSKMVVTSTTDYSGSFTAPQVLNGLQNAEFNLKAMVTPIPYYVMEGLVQVDAAVIPIMEARMNDAGNSITDYLSTNLWTPSASNLDIWSIPDVVSASNPARGNFGGIDRTTNTFWQGHTATVTSVTGSTAWTRDNVLACIASAAKAGSGEMPTFGVVGLGAWAKLATDITPKEDYVITPTSAFSQAEDGAQAVFTALSVAGVPIYADLYSPDTTLTLFNIQYIGFKIHSDAAFAIAGPESLLPNFQLGYIMVLVCLLEFTCSKPAAQSQFTGFTGAFSL